MTYGNNAEDALAAAISEMTGIEQDSVASILQEIQENNDLTALDATETATDKNTAAEITGAVWSDNAQHGPSDLKAAAVDWSSKTVTSSTSDGGASHDQYTHLDITGSGYVVGVHLNWSSNTYFTYEIDGSDWYSMRLNQQSLGHSPLRFNQSLKVSSGTQPDPQGHVWVVLD